MRKLILLLSFLISQSLLSQNNGSTTAKKESSFIKTEAQKAKDKAKIASIELYKVITIDKDTTYIDTTLTIRKEHIFNFLRRDAFGLLPFANEGQTYNTLMFAGIRNAIQPQFGFEAKHTSYLNQNQVKYYSVPTPLTELYFKTTMEQGQSLDAFLTLNTHERLNFSIAYKGLRSLGKYVNTLSSSGNFRFSTNYATKDSRYQMKAHVAVQDILNGENGGIINNSDFESSDGGFRDRNRLQVYTRNANSFLKGNRYFLNHDFRIDKAKTDNSFSVNHQINIENKYFEYKQATLASTITIPGQQSIFVNRYGSSYVSGNIADKTNFNEISNKVTLAYESKNLGILQFFGSNYRFNYFYNSTLVTADGIVPSSVNSNLSLIGGRYIFQKRGWNFNFAAENAVTKQSVSNIDLRGSYDINDHASVELGFQKANAAPGFNYNLFQSSFVEYNWVNDFKNEKSIAFTAKSITKWVNLDLEYSTIADRLFFEQKTSLIPTELIVEPWQYSGTINVFSAKISKDIRYGKFGLDNVLLFQNVQQSEDILNLPKFVCRNSLYYSDSAFRKAMTFQTGFIVNYFTKYYANEYNAVIGEFFVQNQKQIGNFPMLDFFFNAKVRQTRIYFKAEHFNSGFSKNFYASPSNPYRDFIVRFGLVWNFFQ